MNTSALFVPLLLFFFKVRTPLKVLACSFMGFIGVSIIMLTNGSMNINPIHVGYALGAAVLAAMAFISLQELNKHNSPKNIVFYFHLLGFDLYRSFSSHSGKCRHYMDLHYCFWWADSVLFSNYYSLAPLNTRLPMSLRLLLLPVSFFSSICDWLFWDNVPSLNFWIGSLVIIIAVSLLARMRAK